MKLTKISLKKISLLSILNFSFFSGVLWFQKDNHKNSFYEVQTVTNTQNNPIIQDSQRTLVRHRRNTGNRQEFTLSITNPHYNRLSQKDEQNGIQFIEIIDDANGYHSRLQRLIDSYENKGKYGSAQVNTDASFSFNYEW
jgi:hypothetical protein